VEKGTRVKVGSVPHPMQDKHYIVWIAVETDAGESRQFLSPGDSPEAVFPHDNARIRARRCYCNVHGLWAS
jgi:superoxide reductase